MLIYVQFDPWVQQASDEQISVTCAIDKSRDIILTGVSTVSEEGIDQSNMKLMGSKTQLQINVQEDEKAEDRKTRMPKLNSFGLTDLYPSSILGIPSKLQQMVTNHMKTKPPQDTTPTTSPKPSFAEVTTSKDNNSSTKIQSSLLTISEPEKNQGEKIIARLRNEKVDDKLPLTEVFGEWKPIIPSYLKDEELEQWSKIV